MTLHQRPLSEAVPAASPVPPGRGWWSWQRLAQGVWIVLGLMLLTYFVAGIPAFFQPLRTVCTVTDVGNCPTGQLTPIYVQIFEKLHLSIAVAEVFLSALTLAVSVLYWAIGLLIFLRKSQEWMGLFTSLLLIMWGATYLGGYITTAQTPWLLQLLTNSIYTLIGPVLVVFVFTFPTGRFTPRWTLIVFVLVFVVFVLSSLPATAPLVPGVAGVLSYTLGIGVQVYRYVRVYDAVQRQQIKWFVFGVSVVISLILIQGLLGALAPSSPWYQLFNGPMWLLIWTILLLSVSIPILRYRLWDIDVVINRTLVYGSLTVLLVTLYVGLILALQALVRVLTGTAGQQPLVIVGSTLVMAALFQPLRRRLQALIDRRFYRRKYDAAKVVAAFSSTLRTELDLEQLREQLVAVVQETMQPSHVSLWVRQPTSTSIPSLQSGIAAPEKAKVHEENAGHGV
jgi:hypothetical protein